MNQNMFFPGRQDYVGPITGIFGLLHHNQLIESSNNVMERVAYVKREKPPNEIAVRLHNMICLNGCAAATKRAPLDADYEAKRATLDAEIIAYIRIHIPDYAWDGEQLNFMDGKKQ